MSLSLDTVPAINTTDETLVQMLHALGDRNRYKIFRILARTNGLCVSEIAKELDVSVPAVSQHFRIFELVGLVNKKRVGQKICYDLRTDSALVRQLITITQESTQEGGMYA